MNGHIFRNATHQIIILILIYVLIEEKFNLLINLNYF